jgi:MOSC domain-containing protein YiiM
MPCAKLALRFGRPDMVKLFWKSGRSGIYFAIDEEGELAAGDEMTLVEAHPLKVSVADVLALYKGERDEAELFDRVMAAPLAGSWKNHILELQADRAH